jgi:hypothetical protein
VRTQRHSNKGGWPVKQTKTGGKIGLKSRAATAVRLGDTRANGSSRLARPSGSGYHPNAMGYPTPPGKALRSAADHPLWSCLMLGLVAGQAWLTLGLFGPDHSIKPLLDDHPVLSGRHPLHLYHGYLGGRALLTQGSLSCYDPAFFAGYPKTPVFDAGSRPAEIAFALTGGAYRPAVYKVGLAFLCAAVPWLVMVGARGAGLTRAAACLAGGLAVLVWWGRPCRDALEAGDIDVLLAGVLSVAHVGQLLRFHREPGARGLLGAAFTGFLAWLAHPLIPALLLVPFLVYYLSIGARHPLVWHVALLGSLSVAVAANSFWLLDWVEYWWIRVPLHPEGPLLKHRTFQTIWEAPLWGTAADRALACFLAGAALAGIVRANETCCRATARLFGLATFGFLALAVGGIATEAVGVFGTAQLLVPGLLFAAVPAAFGLAGVLGVVRRWTGVGGLGLALAGATAAFVAFIPAHASVWANRLRGPEPLHIGLNDDRTAVCRALADHTTNEARVLWEDRGGTRQGSRWTALLPMLTGRAFIGGLDPEAGIEHVATGLTDQVLAGRPLDGWTDAELRDYCDHYNVSWIVCWSETARRRFGSWAEAEPIADLRDDGAGTLFRLRRQPSFTLSGKARVLSADASGIVLGDVTPRDGKVVLSLHYQAGLIAAPARVSVEPEIDALDPIPFVRLRLEEPVARVTLTWERR